MTHPAQLTTLAALQDDLVFILEELHGEAGREARGRLRDVLARLEAQADVLGEGHAARLYGALEPVLMLLRSDRARAVAALVGIRRGLRNLQLRLEEQRETYPFAREFGWPRECARPAH